MNENPETTVDDVSDVPQVIEIDHDYSAELQEIIGKQDEIITELRYQNEILLEQNNGLGAILNYQNLFYSVFLIVITVVLLWTVLSKWIFRGA